jgi:hypothetical protein
LVRERFFHLDDAYGELVPDGSTDTISITVGGNSKSVALHYLMNWANSDKARLRDPARAVRVWMFIRTWFTDPAIPNTRRYDQMILNAVAPLEKAQ